MDGGTWAPAIAAAADVGGGLLTSAFSVHEARQNRRFQRDMSNTAHQREVADLKKAGLNPILSGTGGHGESTPSGSTPQIDDIKPGASYTSASQAMSSAKLNEALTREHNANADLATTQAKVAAATSAFEMQFPYLRNSALQNQLYLSDVDTTTQSLKARQLTNLSQAQSAKNAAELSKLKIPEAAAMAKFFGGSGGKVEPWLNTAKILSEFLLRSHLGE